MRRRTMGVPQGRTSRHLCGAATILLLGFCAGGCNTTGRPIAATAIPSGATVAFESIDGAPPAVFRKLVHNLNEQAAAQAVPVVSRKGAAAYRIRGYLAARQSGRRTTFAWVWDLYDRAHQRALRISGEERAEASGGDAWAAADDRMLRRMARTGLTRVAMFLGGARPAPSVVPAPGQPSSAIANAAPRNEIAPATPRTARVFRNLDRSETAGKAGTSTADIPLPRRRPQSVGAAPERVIADAGRLR